MTWTLASARSRTLWRWQPGNSHKSVLPHEFAECVYGNSADRERGLADVAELHDTTGSAQKNRQLCMQVSDVSTSATSADHGLPDVDAVAMAPYDANYVVAGCHEDGTRIAEDCWRCQ